MHAAFTVAASVAAFTIAAFTIAIAALAAAALAAAASCLLQKLMYLDHACVFKVRTSVFTTKQESRFLGGIGE